MRKKYLLFLLFSTGALSVSAQMGKSIYGVVLDENRNEMAGVTVVEAGTSNGTVTDADGRWELTLANDGASVEISILGYSKRTIPVGNRREVNIQLDLENILMGEVVVVGYGAQKRESVVGAISSISPSAIGNSSKVKLSQGLAGNISGMIAVQRSGELGQDHADFWIRGISTFKGGANPLVIVDGVERDFNSLDPEEIESFSVLKDASATAIYGVRGANGVIMITTKKGKVQTPKVSVTTEFALKQPTQLPNFVDAVDYMMIANDISQMNGDSPVFRPEKINNTIDGLDPDIYPDVDWIGELTRPFTMHQRVNVNVTGGAPKVRYFISASYHHENGLYVTDTDREWNSNLDMDRVNFRANMDADLTNTTVVSVNIGSQLAMMNTPKGGSDWIWNLMMEAPPYFIPIRYSDGRLAAFGAGSEKGRNPYNQLTQLGNNSSAENNMSATGSIEQKLDFLTKGLKAKVTYAYDVWTGNYYNANFSPELWYATSRAADGTLNAVQVEPGNEFLNKSVSSSMSYKTYLEATLNYDRTFGRHGVGALVLFNRSVSNVSSASDEYGAIPYRHQGIAGRVTYNFDRRFYAEFNFGYNGSENFAKGHRYGFFPAIAAGWLISEESFWEPVRHIVNKLKIRGSIGNVGNDVLNNLRFAYITKITNDGGYNFGGPGESGASFTGLKEDDLGNMNLTWETETKRDIGIEIVLLDGLELDVDYFYNSRRDILVQREVIPGTTGLNVNPIVNFGRMINRGVDATVRYNYHKGDWSVSALGTFTFARNKITEMDEPTRLYPNLTQTGHRFGQQFGLIAEGLYTDDDFDGGSLKRHYPVPQFGVDVRPGDIKYRDVNGDGNIDTNDRTAIGFTETPEIVYGFGVNAMWKHIEVGFRFQGVANTTRFINSDNFLPFANTMQKGNLYEDVIFDRWTTENPSQNTFFPRLRGYKDGHNFVNSTWWQKDMSFLRLKEVVVAWHFPPKWLKGVGLEKGRIYFLANNLFTISKFKLWDVELGTNDGMKYPMMRSYSMGLELNF
jgi:TonB-linked SusC/RagA family outer membrane protein